MSNIVPIYIVEVLNITAGQQTMADAELLLDNNVCALWDSCSGAIKIIANDIYDRVAILNGLITANNDRHIPYYPNFTEYCLPENMGARVDLDLELLNAGDGSGYNLNVTDEDLSSLCTHFIDVYGDDIAINGLLEAFYAVYISGCYLQFNCVL